MSNFPLYGFCALVAASVAVLLGMSTEFFVSYVNDILIPCQHDSDWRDGQCVCDNSRGVFGGKYCDECQCKHLGICTITEITKSRWGCRCPSHQKWVGTLCDKCYAVENKNTSSCRGECMEVEYQYKHYGPKCNKVCMPYVSSSDPHCLEVFSGGGVCNACNNHGVCSENGECKCNDGFFTPPNGEQCSASCSGANINCPEDRGYCDIVGGELQCFCKEGYYGKNCEDQCPGKMGVDNRIIPCSGHGSCELDDSGDVYCQCNIHYTGDDCSLPCPGDLSYPNPCSGHGVCSQTSSDTAQCECSGTWESFDCSCSPRYTCSGHGQCQEDGSCACFNETDPEIHFSGSSCETCEEHWDGTSCQLRCDPGLSYVSGPQNGLNIGCNGHGSCELTEIGTVEHITCLCADTNPDTYCATCMPDYYPDIRLPNITAVPPCSVECNEQTCSFRGRCNPDYNGKNDLCICDKITVGTVVFDTLDPEQYCSTCKNNWYPSKMDDPNRCTSFCADDGNIETDTNNQWIVFKDGNIKTYDLRDNIDAQKVCSAFSMDNGTRYAPDADCRVCSGSGTCRANGECKCSLGTTGVYCNVQCGTENEGDSVCSGHGRCVRNELDMWFNPYTENFRCECTPYDTYTSETRQRLIKRGFQVDPPPIPDYYGQFCDYHCPHYNEKICNDRGDCKTVVASDDEGFRRQCLRDADCYDISGAFCDHLSTPWDSLMVKNGSMTGNSFFGASIDSPGYYTCAKSTECIDSIYSVSWDEYCVNMLNGWYPNILNTADCTYKETSNCRLNVENFFMDGVWRDNKTWCESAIEVLKPPLDGVCGPTSYADEEKFKMETVPLCYEYTNDLSCNAQKDCIYDQRGSYISFVDSECAGKSIDVQDNDCSGRCRLDTEGQCRAKTYCRAKTCSDIMYENNVESLCLNLPEACPATNFTTNNYTDWTDFCAQSSGSIRNSATELNSLETFFNCYMYENRYNPQLVSVGVPGGISLNGMLRVFGEDVDISEFRQSFLSSRIAVSESECSAIHFSSQVIDGISQNGTEFCTNHLSSVVPDWYVLNVELTDWYLPWLVVCEEGEDSLWPDASSADRRIKDTGRKCVKYYKSPGLQGDTWGVSTDEKDNILYRSYPWTLECLNNAPMKLDKIDYNEWPQTRCRLETNEIAQRWGQQAWTPDDVQKKFAESCAWLEYGPWIPKSEKIPTLCDMGACSPEHTCLMCSETDCFNTSASVMCISDSLVNCRSSNPCQKNGNCYQPPQMLYQAAYLCDWLQNETVVVEIGDDTLNGTLSKRGLVTVYNAAGIIPRRANITIGAEKKLIMTHWITSDSDVTFQWTNASPTEENQDEIDISNIRKCTDSLNWADFCSSNSLGTSLSTKGPFGLISDWSGSAELFSNNTLMVTDLRIVFQVRRTLSIEHSGYVKIICRGQTRYSSGMFNASMDTGSCSIVSMYAPVLVSSIKLDNVEQIQSFETALRQDSSRAFYFPTESDVSGFASWTFSNNQLKNVRSFNDVLPQMNICVDETCSGAPPPRGVRWNIEYHGDLRVSGWGKINDNLNHIMDMQLQNYDFTPVMSVYVYQHRLYVNDAKTECKVRPDEWFHFSLDAKHHSEGEARQTNQTELQFDLNTTVFDQLWELSVRIDNCEFKPTELTPVTSTKLTRKHPNKISSHYHWLQTPSLQHCHDVCDGASKCKQYSWHGHGCHLYDTVCHEDSNCVHGAHTLHSFQSHRIDYFEIFNLDAGAAAYWTDIRTEPMIASPFACNKPSNLPARWKESFTELYRHFDPDVTAVCNELDTEWRTLPGYRSHVCSGSECEYKEHDLKSCARQIEYSVPSDCSDPEFNSLNWTSYCRYVESFEPVFIGASEKQIPFLGGVDFDFENGCQISKEILSNGKSICEDISTDWFSECFQRTSEYESFCSGDCIDSIESMLADSGEHDGICTLRHDFLDIADEFGEGCEGCDLGDMLITDFCLMQSAYHEGEYVKIPELDMACDTSCTTTLQDTMGRSSFRQWCENLSDGEIPGVCSKTVCECNSEDNPRVAGAICDLDCPSGISDGRELACSGANGQCFPIDRNQREEDTVKQQNAGEFRKNTSIAGPYVPKWIRGPDPHINGRCQCQLGSGADCSVPCDRCNNGTYGAGLASQYGICDSYNGICRGLAPLMRLNVKGNGDLSYNTTAFELSNSVTEWKYPNDFLYENDQVLFDLSLRDTLDAEGLATGIIQSRSITVYEKKNIRTVLSIFRDLCWEDIASYPHFSYLNNSNGIYNRGIDVFPLILKTTALEGTPKCTEIDMVNFVLCFTDGKMFASTKKNKLYVVNTGVRELPTSKMTFAKRNMNTVYAFGGERQFTTSSQQFNTLYKLTVEEIQWSDPRNIIFVHWEQVNVDGSPPPAQSFAPIFSYSNALYLLSTKDSTRTLFKLSYDNPRWISVSQFEKDAYVRPKYLQGVTNEMIHVYFDDQTSASYNNDVWSLSTLTTDTDIHTLADAISPTSYQCKIEVRNNSIVIGGNTVASYNAAPNSIKIYLEEWLTIDVNSNADTYERFQNAIQLFSDAPESLDYYIGEATAMNIKTTLDYISRIYMHQARWTYESMLRLQSTFYADLGLDNLVRVDGLFIDTGELKQLFATISTTVLDNTLITHPNKVVIRITDESPNKNIILSARYDTDLNGYDQTIDLGSAILDVNVVWTKQVLYVKLKHADGVGYISWTVGAECKSWVLVFGLEQFILNPEMDLDLVFDFYAMSEVQDTFEMKNGLSTFLQYSSTHCSLTANQKCPGQLPYTRIPCSGRGRCGISCQCVCEAAKSVLEINPNALRNPSWTDSPWRGHGCELTCPGYDGYDIDTICSKKGTCQRDATCSCEDGYTGDSCQFKCPRATDSEGNLGEICSTHGGCGTRTVSVQSFDFEQDKYLDTLAETNRRSFENALLNYYGQCSTYNYFHLQGQFQHSVVNHYPSRTKLSRAQLDCDTINAQLNLDITQEDNRVYPVGRCMGIREIQGKYTPVTLRARELRNGQTFSSMPVFRCVLNDCTLRISDNDDQTLINLQHSLVGSLFEFTMNYEHGYSTGRVQLIVNLITTTLEFHWDMLSLTISISTELYGKTTIVSENKYYKRVTLSIALNTLIIKLYPETRVVYDHNNDVWLAPNYIKNYQDIDDPHLSGRFFRIKSEDTGFERVYLTFKHAEYDCDMEPECDGIIQWDIIFEETYYSLYTEKSFVNNAKLRPLNSVTNKYTYLKKMSFYYRGKNNGQDTCEKILPKQSKYPTIPYKEYYNTPIRDIDIDSVLDQETGSVVVGDGVWTKCWKKVEKQTKSECYNHAKFIDKVYGFAFSDDPPVCLIYTGISKNTNIKLDRFTNEQRLSLDDPCDEDADWITI